MAIVSGPVATVTFNLIDETGSRSSLQLFAPFATTVADLVTALNAIRADIVACSGCAVEGWSISFAAAENTLLTPNAGSRVERKGVIIMNTAVATKYSRISLPGILPSLLVDGGRIDEDAAAMATFLGNLVSGPWTDSNGNAITGLRSAYERFSSTTRTQLPSVRVPDPTP